MIEQNTVLVLGAGASAPFDFPTGQRLKDLICIETLRQASLVQLLEELGFDEDIITSFRKALLNSGRPSVDAFLESREDYLDIGKTAIAVTLLPLEKTTGLFGDWIKKRQKGKGNWYDSLFDALTAAVPFDEFDKNKLSIITFNYDRSIEHYLFTSLQSSYNKNDEECGEKLRKMEIIHVHGSLGPLDWQSRPVDLPSVPYDSGIPNDSGIPKIIPDIIKLAAQNIKIIHEGIADTPEFLCARQIMRHANRVFFLGFGYHPTNMKRLEMGRIHEKETEVMGTSQGLSYQRKEEIQRLYPNFTEGSFDLIPKDVYTFLHEHVSFG